MRTESDTYNDVEYVRVLLFDCYSMNLANKLWANFCKLMCASTPNALEETRYVDLS